MSERERVIEGNHELQAIILAQYLNAMYAWEFVNDYIYFGVPVLDNH